MRAPDVAIVCSDVDVLGEAPQWNSEDGRLYWVDSFAPGLRRLDPESGRIERHALDADIGSFVFAREGSLVCGMRGGFRRVVWGQPGSTPLADPLAYEPRLVPNDGMCDRRGRY